MIEGSFQFARYHTHTHTKLLKACLSVWLVWLTVPISRWRLPSVHLPFASRVSKRIKRRVAENGRLNPPVRCHRINPAPSKLFYDLSSLPILANCHCFPLLPARCAGDTLFVAELARHRRGNSNLQRQSTAKKTAPHRNQNHGLQGLCL